MDKIEVVLRERPLLLDIIDLELYKYPLMLYAYQTREIWPPTLTFGGTLIVRQLRFSRCAIVQCLPIWLNGTQIGTENLQSCNSQHINSSNLIILLCTCVYSLLR